MLLSRDSHRNATGEGWSWGCRLLRNEMVHYWVPSQSAFLCGSFEVNVGFDLPSLVYSVFGFLSMSRSRSRMATGWYNMRLLSGLKYFALECLPLSKSRSLSQSHSQLCYWWRLCWWCWRGYWFCCWLWASPSWLDYWFSLCHGSILCKENATAERLDARTPVLLILDPAEPCFSLRLAGGDHPQDRRSSDKSGHRSFRSTP